MYVVQEKPDKEVCMTNLSKHVPLVTLKDEYGGVSHIILDDNCYVLVNGSQEGGFRTVKHWYSEAVQALISHEAKLYNEPVRN